MSGIPEVIAHNFMESMSRDGLAAKGLLAKMYFQAVLFKIHWDLQPSFK